MFDTELLKLLLKKSNYIKYAWRGPSSNKIHWAVSRFDKDDEFKKIMNNEYDLKSGLYLYYISSRTGLIKLIATINEGGIIREPITYKSTRKKSY